jgi:predicted nucleic acid-binding protein
LPFILDASATLPWCFSDESTDASEYLLLRAQAGERIFVSANWPMEILQGVTKAARRGRIDDPRIDLFLVSLLSYDIAVDTSLPASQWTLARPFITKYRLSAYDAAYLALAKRLALPFASFDGKLREAATAEGIDLAT